MALGGKSTKKDSSGGKKESKYVTIFQILEGKENDDGAKEPWAKASTYKGRLVWQEFGGDDGNDEENSTFYEIQKAFIGKPHESAPDFVLQTLVVNLKNPKAARPLAD